MAAKKIVIKSAFLIFSFLPITYGIKKNTTVAKTILRYPKEMGEMKRGAIFFTAMTLVPKKKLAATKAAAVLIESFLYGLIFEDFSTSHYFLCFFIECYFLTCSCCCIGHDGCNRMCVPCFNWCIGLFSASHTLHPIADVCGC